MVLTAVSFFVWIPYIKRNRSYKEIEKAILGRFFLKTYKGIKKE